MPLKKSKGNMYDWVTHMHSHIAGECSHNCRYCYVQRNKFGVSPRYKGKPRLVEYELNVNYGLNNVIFIEHMQDLFATSIKDEWILKILEHCRKYPNNKYIFQTKNPLIAMNYFSYFPTNYMIGTTIETNRDIFNISDAINPYERYLWIKKFKAENCKIFVTIEPIMDFDIDMLSAWIINLKPDFVNIGADSKGGHLTEPSAQKILEFIDVLNKNEITIKKKTNLDRLIRYKNTMRRESV